MPSESDALANDFTCPISGDIMSDPVIAADGHTYERAMIAEWLRHRQTSPLTNQALGSVALIPNHTLKKVIADWIAAKSNPRPSATEAQANTPHLAEVVDEAELEQVKSLVYRAYNSEDEVLLVSRVASVQNANLHRSFERCKARVGGRVKRLFHGTASQSAASIAAEGFRVPEQFQRADNLQETGQLTFGKAMYYSERADLACDFGEATLVIADVALGREWQAEQSMPNLDTDRMCAAGKDSVIFERTHEYACYNSAQALPVYVVTYKLVNGSDLSETYDRHTLDTTYERMSTAASIDWEVVLKHVGPDGRPRQRHAALRMLGDVCRDDHDAMVSRGLPAPLLHALRDQCLSLAAAEADAPVTWLALRLCWNAAYQHRETQGLLVKVIGADVFLALLGHWNMDVVDRAAGVLLNLSQLSSTARKALWAADAPLALARRVADHAESLLDESRNMFRTSAVGAQPVPHCLGAIANLAFASDTRTRFLASRELKAFLLGVAEPLMDSWSEEVRDEATRLFTCLIAEGQAPAEWIEHGGAEVFQKSVSLEE